MRMGTSGRKVHSGSSLTFRQRGDTCFSSAFNSSDPGRKLSDAWTLRFPAVKEIPGNHNEYGALESGDPMFCRRCVFFSADRLGERFATRTTDQRDEIPSGITDNGVANPTCVDEGPTKMFDEGNTIPAY